MGTRLPRKDQQVKSFIFLARVSLLRASIAFKKRYSQNVRTPIQSNVKHCIAVLTINRTGGTDAAKTPLPT